MRCNAQRKCLQCFYQCPIACKSLTFLNRRSCTASLAPWISWRPKPARQDRSWMWWLRQRPRIWSRPASFAPGKVTDSVCAAVRIVTSFTEVCPLFTAVCRSALSGVQGLERGSHANQADPEFLRIRVQRRKHGIEVAQDHAGCAARRCQADGGAAREAARDLHPVQKCDRQERLAVPRRPGTFRSILSLFVRPSSSDTLLCTHACRRASSTSAAEGDMLAALGCCNSRACVAAWLAS